MRKNIILLTDSYKQAHHKMYPPGLEYMHSYFEARTGGEFDRVLFFGLQYFLAEYLRGTVLTQDMIDEAEDFNRRHFGMDLFNRDGWQHILDRHKGVLPVEIFAVDEGTVVPESNVLFSIINTDPKVPWLVNHLETLLVQTWYPTTVATISYHLRKVLAQALDRSGTPDTIGLKLHDFGFRGSTSVESAALGGAAHLINFVGTDNLAGCELLRQYYTLETPMWGTRKERMPGVSVPAAEHSTITAWGKDNELHAYGNILEQYPEGYVAVVSDSWDIFHAVEKLWGMALNKNVKLRNGTVVIRPDSGDPVANLLKILDLLEYNFPVSKNDKGYKVLPDYIRLIQGDGISRKTLPNIVLRLQAAGWSLDNFVFGSGGGLLQDCNRDTQRFAFKCSYAQIDGEPREVRKNPQSDLSKASKAGILGLVGAGDSYQTTSQMPKIHDTSAMGTRWIDRGNLHCVFIDGAMIRKQNYEWIRKITWEGA